MNAITRCVLCWFLHQPGMRETVLEWLAAQPDPQKRITDFGLQLYADFTKEHCIGERKNPDLADALLAEAVEHVAWTKVAAELLDRFAKPKRVQWYLCNTSIN